MSDQLPLRLVASLLLILSFLASCTKPQQDEADNSSFPESEAISSGSGVVIPLTSSCGVVVDGILYEGLNAAQAEAVSVEALNTDLVIVRSLYGDLAGSPQLVQLQGLTAEGVSPFKRQQGVSQINRMAGSYAFFVQAGRNCATVVDGGGAGVIGQIFTSGGDSINEALLKSGQALPRLDSCGGDVLYDCYNKTEVAEEFSSLILNNFLWKPVSDNDGNLVIGVDEFITVKVTGALTETQSAQRYAGSPYVSFLRFSRPGCSYGNSIRVEFFDQNGLTVKTATGLEQITINSGCSREELRF